MSVSSWETQRRPGRDSPSQPATYAIYETLTWRYDLYAQSQDRNHRIGQQAAVTYVRLLATDTIDFVIAESLARKTRMARRLVGDEDHAATIADMTPEGFRDMLLTNKLPNTPKRKG